MHATVIGPDNAVQISSCDSTQNVCTLTYSTESIQQITSYHMEIFFQVVGFIACGLIGGTIIIGIVLSLGTIGENNHLLKEIQTKLDQRRKR